MTNDDLEQIRLIVREAVAPLIAPLAADVTMMRSDITQLRHGLQTVEDRLEMLTGHAQRWRGSGAVGRAQSDRPSAPARTEAGRADADDCTVREGQGAMADVSLEFISRQVTLLR